MAPPFGGQSHLERCNGEHNTLVMFYMCTDGKTVLGVVTVERVCTSHATHEATKQEAAHANVHCMRCARAWTCTGEGLSEQKNTTFTVL